VNLNDGINLDPGDVSSMSLDDAFQLAIPSDLDGTGSPEVELRQARELLFTARLLQSLTPEILKAESERLVALAEEQLATISHTLETAS
jgi:hypothetical protein